jgi:TRAP-type uncharacterized transport system substrate-binding protein
MTRVRDGSLDSGGPRALRALVCAGLLMVGAGCVPDPPLRLIVTPDDLMPGIGQRLAEVLVDDGIEIEVVEGRGTIANLERLAKGEADLAIAENNAPYLPGVSTVLPLFREVLHILHEKGLRPKDGTELLRGKRIFAGAEGGMGRFFLALIAEQLNLGPSEYEIVDDPNDAIEVIFLFQPISPSVTARIEDDYDFFSIGDVDDLGKGATVEGLSLIYPQMEPFVIPARSYGHANPAAILTVSVTTLLVARDDLPSHRIHDLAEALIDNKQQLALVHPSLFHGITERFNVDSVNFPLHDGAQDYLDRDEPGFLERYAELAGVLFTVSLALLSGLVAIARLRQRIKKNRIDGYYARVLRIRADALKRPLPVDWEEASERIREVESEAFDELIDERLLADDAFRIFLTLSRETLHDFERRRDAG